MLPAVVGTAASAAGASSPGSPEAPPPPRPPDATITSDTAAQFYELRSPTGETIIARRRLTTTLGVAVYDLLDVADDPLAPSLSFRARLRYDADYGGSAEETAHDRFARFVPGFSRGPVDLMYGYVEGRRYLRGLLGFRLGRQYVTDALGWWSFDGGLVKVTTPYFVAFEVYGGLEQRGGMPLSTPRFERDGVWRGDREGFAEALHPSFQQSEVAPAIGAAIESAGFTWLHGRATYRRVYNTGASNLSQWPSEARPPATFDGMRISQERIGYAIDGTLPGVGGVKAGFSYDLYTRQMATMFSSVDWYATDRVTLSADWDYFQPTFDGDSIWNFFLAMPMNDVGLRAAWDPTRRVGLAAGVRARAFLQTTGPAEERSSPRSPSERDPANEYPASPIEPMGGANLAARYRIGEGTIGARGAADVARTGERLGLDVYGERTLETRYVLQGRAGVWHWEDDLRPDRHATSFGYVLGAGYKVLPQSLILVDFQHDMNRVAGQRFRAMVWLTLALSSAKP